MEAARFGELIRSARERKNIKAFELADMMRTHGSAISRLENGTFKEAPAPEVLAELHRILGLEEREMLVALGYLRGEAEDAPERPSSRLRDRLHAAVDAVDWDRATNMAATLLEIMAAQRHDQEHGAKHLTTRQPVPETVQSR